MKNTIDKKELLKTIGIGALCVVLFAGVLLSVLFGMGYSLKTAEKIAEELPNGNPLVVETTFENGIALSAGEAMVASDGSTSQTLTASLLSSSGEDVDGTLKWTYDFVNKESDWCKLATTESVESYVVLSFSENSKVCTIKCLQSFGEQIKITCSAPAYGFTADTTVDYVRRFKRGTTTSLNGKIVGGSNLKVYPYNVAKKEDYLNTIEFSLTFDVGSTFGEYVPYVHCGLFNTNFNRIVAEVPTSSASNGSFIEVADYSWNEVETITRGTLFSIKGTCSFYVSVSDLVVGAVADDYAKISDLLHAKPAGVSYSNYIDVQVCAKTCYGGETYSYPSIFPSKNYTNNLSTFIMPDYVPTVESLNLNKSSIAF